MNYYGINSKIKDRLTEIDSLQIYIINNVILKFRPRRNINRKMMSAAQNTIQYRDETRLVRIFLPIINDHLRVI